LTNLSASEEKNTEDTLLDIVYVEGYAQRKMFALMQIDIFIVKSLVLIMTN